VLTLCVGWSPSKSSWGTIPLPLLRLALWSWCSTGGSAEFGFWSALTSFSKNSSLWPGLAKFWFSRALCLAGLECLTRWRRRGAPLSALGLSSLLAWHPVAGCEKGTELLPVWAKPV
jgi:hypothetical protein